MVTRINIQQIVLYSDKIFLVVTETTETKETTKELK